MRTPAFRDDGKFDKTRRNNEIFDDTRFSTHIIMMYARRLHVYAYEYT